MLEWLEGKYLLVCVWLNCVGLLFVILLDKLVEVCELVFEVWVMIVGMEE